MIAYIFDGDSMHRVSQEGDELSCRFVATPIPSGADVACFSAEEFYFIDRDAPDVLRRRKAPLDCTEHPLPGPAHGVIVHHRKVYCCGSDCLYVFDPLSAEVETLELHHSVLQVEAAGHGFVFVDSRNTLCAFHFNCGVKEVEIKGQTVQLLGRYNHFVVVLVDFSQIFCVNESGEVRDNMFPFLITTPFILLDADTVLTCQDETKLCLYRQDALVAVTEAWGAETRLLSVPSADSEDTCLICLCDFDDGDGVTLDCGHCFHRDCVAEFSVRADSFRAKGEHIVFTYSVCPGGCGSHIRHAAAPRSAYMTYLYWEMRRDAARQLRGVDNKTVEDLLYYVCCRCEKPFYGGERKCFRSLHAEPAKSPDELICSDCRDDFFCTHHNRDFVFYKCRYCCSPATHLSFGNRYLCDRCEGLWETTEPQPTACPGPDKCPLMGSHSENGSFPLGCMLCVMLDEGSSRPFFSL